jgi:hypothetical protein
MTIYTATFRKADTWATKEIDAMTPEQALLHARALIDNDDAALDWCTYDPSPVAVDEIEIANPDGADACWRSEELALRLAASELLEALQFCAMTLADLECSKRKGYIAEAIELARAAIAKARPPAA